MSPADDPDVLHARAAEAGIHRLAIPTPFAVGRVNCWLIEDDPLTLVDVGPNSGRSLDEVERGLAGSLPVPRDKRQPSGQVAGELLGGRGRPVEDGGRGDRQRHARLGVLDLQERGVQRVHPVHGAQSSRLRILFAAFLGSASRNSTDLGYL